MTSQLKIKVKKIIHLKLCHDLLVKAYNARLAHSDAFAPECHDFGHNLQFQIIQDKIDKCRLEFSKIDEKNNNITDSTKEL